VNAYQGGRLPLAADTLRKLKEWLQDEPEFEDLSPHDILLKIEQLEGKVPVQPTSCPTCQSPEPRLHPAVSGGGEVTHVCSDPFHYRALDPPDIEAVLKFKQEAQAILRGDDAWRHPDISEELIEDTPDLSEAWRHPDIPEERVSIQRLVIHDVREREQHGVKTYGSAIYADTPNDPIEGGPIGQCYREALDLVIYLRWFIERHGISL
jgi:hypothetical protein